MMKQRANILLVEDNKMDVVLTLDAFRQVYPDYRVHVVGDGLDALDYLFARKQYADRQTYPLPDMILLDLKLPKMHGHDVLQAIRQSKHLTYIPILVLSSSKEEKDVQQSYEYGANGYLVKPISFNEFLDMVAKIGEFWLGINLLP